MGTGRKIAEWVFNGEAFRLIATVSSHVLEKCGRDALGEPSWVEIHRWPEHPTSDPGGVLTLLAGIRKLAGELSSVRAELLKERSWSDS